MGIEWVVFNETVTCTMLVSMLIMTGNFSHYTKARMIDHSKKKLNSSLFTFSVVGAVFAGLNDIEYNFVGYLWMAANCMFTAGIFSRELDHR